MSIPSLSMFPPLSIVFKDTDSSVPVLTRHEGVACIYLNRPQHFNRLHQEDLDHLLALFEQINISVYFGKVSVCWRCFAWVGW